MNSVASSTQSPLETASHARHDSEIHRTISSTLHVLEQAPPPSLREVLGAYQSKGDGDRDLLIAMLNAKSSEDQRMASVAALHRTLLEIYHTPPVAPLHPLHMHPSADFHSPHSIPLSPPNHEIKPMHNVGDSDSGCSPSSSPTTTREAPAPPASALPSQKRQRTSHDSSPHHTKPNESHVSMKHGSLPPSPHSSSRSNSAEYSPRPRASMAIGSLLSSGPSSRGTHGDRANDYISPSTSFGPISV